MRKILWVACLLGASLSLSAQATISPTDSFAITGTIKNPQTITPSVLNGMTQVALGDIASLNHRKQSRGTMKNVKGIRLRALLQKIELDIASPKLLYGFYVECIATDGYKTVLSWNEIMNSPAGEDIFIIVERDGKKISELDDRFAILQLYGSGQGHVYIRGLRQLIIESVK